jgi:hypothetical protein
MTIRQTAAGLGAGVTATVIVLAGATIWLVLSDPVAVAGAVGDGDVSALAVALLKLVGRQLVRLVFGR